MSGFEPTLSSLRK